jgi:hypothetical protein
MCHVCQFYFGITVVHNFDKYWVTDENFQLLKNSAVVKLCCSD